MTFSHAFVSAFLDALLAACGGDQGFLASRAPREPLMNRVYQGVAHTGANLRPSGQNPELTPRSSEFGALLRRHRLASGLSQEALAERAQMSSNGIGALERGYRRTPQRQTLSLLVGALGLKGAERAQFESAARSVEPASVAFDPNVLGEKASGAGLLLGAD
ncbi:MAG: helix-turn-helix transcriptional regulator [Candidatus Cybelea sp.]